MFEKEIKYISDNSLNKIKKLGAYFTIDQLSTSDLHPAIIKYINSEMDYLIYIDRKDLVKKSAFDYSNPEIVRYLNLIGKEIKSSKKISFEDAKNLIVQAVSFTANFLVRPKWSLTKFIYNEDQLKSVDEIKLSLNYLHYYEYLKNVLITYIEKKQSLNLSLIDFEVALNKVDKELFSKHTQELVDNALYSIADFFSLAGVETNKISPSCVELFLKEKDLIDQLFRLRRSLPVNAKPVYKIDDIKKIIYTSTGIKKSQILPSKTREEESSETDMPVKLIIDKQEPDIIIENKKEVIEEEVFDFKDDDKIVDNEIMFEKEEEHNDEQSPGIEEIKNDIESEHDSEQETEIELEPESNIIAESGTQIESKDSNDQQPEKIEGENLNKELDSLLDEELLTNLSSDDDLLDAFDSQLKALEEESNLLLTESEELANENDSPGEQTENQSDKSKDEVKNQPELHDESIDSNEQLKIELETEEKNEIEDNLLEFKENPDEENLKEDWAESLNTEQKIGEEKRLRKRAPQREKDLLSFISNKEIEKVVVNVFNEDREDFANTMEKITECFDYDEATEILKAVFFSYRVNPYTRDAVTLTNAVSNYFSQAT